MNNILAQPPVLEKEKEKGREEEREGSRRREEGWRDCTKRRKERREGGKGGRKEGIEGRRKEEKEGKEAGFCRSCSLHDPHLQEDFWSLCDRL